MPVPAACTYPVGRLGAVQQPGACRGQSSRPGHSCSSMKHAQRGGQLSRGRHHKCQAVKQATAQRLSWLAAWSTAAPRKSLLSRLRPSWP